MFYPFRLSLALIVLGQFCASGVLVSTLNGQETAISSVDRERWEFKLEEKHHPKRKSDHRVSYLYQNKLGVEFKADAYFDVKGGKRFFTSAWSPRHSRIFIATPFGRSSGQLAMWKNFDNSNHPELPNGDGSSIDLNIDYSFETVGFKKPTGIGLFDLIVDNSKFALESGEGKFYQPVSLEKGVLLKDSLGKLLKEKYQVSVIPKSSGEVVGTRKHMRNGLLRFEETTVRHPTRGLHKHYVFYQPAGSNVSAVSCSVYQDGEFAHLKKKEDLYIWFSDEQLDGHFEWMILDGENQSHFDLIDMTDLWNIRLSTQEQYDAYIEYLKINKEEVDRISEHYQRLKKEGKLKGKSKNRNQQEQDTAGEK